jgi:hypothetical protein
MTLYIEKNLAELTNDWLSLLRNRQEDAALQLYCEKIIPTLLPDLRSRFLSENGYDPSSYDGLISLLGFSPDTVILTYRFIQPKSIVVLHTPATASLIDTVLRYTDIPHQSFSHEVFHEEPYTDIFRALDIARKRLEGNKIAIELTGGKKIMGTALAMAASILNIDLLYIDYKVYLPEFRKPAPESTFFRLMKPPQNIWTI